MVSNDAIVLDSLLNQNRHQNPDLSESEQFELFTFEQLLKDYELSDDELKTGHVDGADDGGFDGIFTFINDELVLEDFDVESVKRNPSLELHLVQSKTSSGFGETAIHSVCISSQLLFDLGQNLDQLKHSFNALVLRQISIFRRAYIALATKHPRVRIVVSFVSKGSVAELHPKVVEKSRLLMSMLAGQFSGADIEVKFAGARELLELSRTDKSYTLQLKFVETFISRDDFSYVLLARLTDYFKFVTDDGGKLRRYIFESNVRDYQGNVEVNKEIGETLSKEEQLDFWWLNNGITILSSHASIAGKAISLDDVQVVNGLQTTETIYNHLRDLQNEDDRAILIKIVVTTDPAARDRIIKATNFQTPITPASLKAMDRIQRDIEDYFKHHGYYYDRRKNFYKNQGKPADSIVGIAYLAQAIMAMLLKEPDNSRARPSSLLKRPSDYDRVFSESTPLPAYLNCARLMKKIEKFVRSSDEEPMMWVASNLRFHLAMYCVCRNLKCIDYEASQLSADLVDRISEDELNQYLNEVFEFGQIEEDDYDYDWEKMAKSRDFVEDLLKEAQVRSDSSA